MNMDAFDSLFAGPLWSAYNFCDPPTHKTTALLRKPRVTKTWMPQPYQEGVKFEQTRYLVDPKGLGEWLSFHHLRSNRLELFKNGKVLNAGTKEVLLVSGLWVSYEHIPKAHNACDHFAF